MICHGKGTISCNGQCVALIHELCYLNNDLQFFSTGLPAPFGNFMAGNKYSLEYVPGLIQ